ncbi:MAG: hypothetical protein PHH48_02470 [Eubacteriales bacterium]|nr:hypothetical protein [Eubacteriales bacterium]
MLSKTHSDYPTYLEIGFKNGEATSVNGKELNQDGISTVLSYICRETNLRAEEVLNKAKNFAKSDDAVKLKLFNGAISQF